MTQLIRRDVLSVTGYLCLTCSCLGQTRIDDTHVRPQQDKTGIPNFAAAVILQRMPMNNEKRCVGIAAVAEALLEGEIDVELEQRTSADDVARKIHAALPDGQRLTFPSHLEIEGHRVQIDDKRSIEKLSDLVAELYKQEHLRLSKSNSGVGRLIAAQNRTVPTKQQLERILSADEDGIAMFCCFGARRFDGDEVKLTNHAILLRRSPRGQIEVFDPNAPGIPIECETYEDGQQLTLEWKCAYRDTGEVTTQRYAIVHAEVFFRVARGGTSVAR